MDDVPLRYVSNEDVSLAAEKALGGLCQVTENHVRRVVEALFREKFINDSHDVRSRKIAVWCEAHAPAAVPVPVLFNTEEVKKWGKKFSQWYDERLPRSKICKVLKDRINFAIVDAFLEDNQKKGNTGESTPILSKPTDKWDPAHCELLYRVSLDWLSHLKPSDPEDDHITSIQWATGSSAASALLALYYLFLGEPTVSVTGWCFMLITSAAILCFSLWGAKYLWEASKEGPSSSRTDSVKNAKWHCEWCVSLVPFLAAGKTFTAAT